MSASAYMAAGSGALRLWSSYQQAEMIREQTEIANNIADINAKYAEIEADRAEAFGQTKAARMQTVADKVLGRQKAKFAAAGVDADFGTAKSIVEESELNTFFNIQDIQKAARNRARGLRNEASNTRIQSFMRGLEAESEAQATQTRGIASAAQSGLQAYQYSGYDITGGS